MPAVTCPKCGAALKPRGNRAFCTKCRKSVILKAGGGSKKLILLGVGLLATVGIVTAAVIAARTAI